MTRTSSYEKTYQFLLDRGEKGASMDDILELGIHRATFFRHRKRINEKPDAFVESFDDTSGQTRFRIRSRGDNVIHSATHYLQPRSLLGGVEMNYGLCKPKSVTEWYKKHNDLEGFNSLETPTYDIELIDDQKWDILKDAIASKKAIRVKKYECPTWEIYPVKEPIIFPEDVIVFADQYYLKGLWFNEGTYTQVYMNFAGLVEYGRVTSLTLPSNIEEKKPRWHDYIIGIHSMENRISAEIWHPSQIDIMKSNGDKDWSELNTFINIATLDVSIVDISPNTYKSIVQSNFKMLRIIPFVNELTRACLYRHSESIQLLSKK